MASMVSSTASAALPSPEPTQEEQDAADTEHLVQLAALLQTPDEAAALDRAETTAALTVKAQRLEPAIGVHLANNLSLFSIVQNPEVTPAEPIWRLAEPVGMSWALVATAIVAAVVFWVVFFGVWGRRG